MIGQERLLKIIDTSVIDYFPHSLILLGKRGSGKHTILEKISNKLSLPIEDITENLTLDTLTRIYQIPNPTIYCIDTSKITFKDQNVILKFLEEPTKAIFVVLLCENINSLLETVINRCRIWELDRYTEEQLRQFSTDEHILKYCSTPGQILKMTEHKTEIEQIEDLCYKIYSKIDKASYPNTLSIADKIAFKNEKDLIDYSMFLDILFIQMKELTASCSNSGDSEVYKATDCLYNDYYAYPNLNHKARLESYLLELKEIKRNEN